MANSLRDDRARELALQVTEAVRARRDGKDGKTEIVVRSDDEGMQALKEKIIKLEAQALEPKNDIQPTPRALGDILNEVNETRQQMADMQGQINSLKNNPVEIVSSEPAELKDEIKAAVDIAHEIGAASLNNFGILNHKIGVIEGKLARLELQLATFFSHIERPATGS